MVDDSAAVRERVLVMLSEIAGVEIVGEASDGPSAIVLARASQPHAIVLDLQMRGGNGIDVLAELKRGPSSPLLIVLTNHADDQHRRRCLARGADHFFDKSTEFELVADVLARTALLGLA